jgi:thiosulfate reductase cytochrome b subunit
MDATAGTIAARAADEREQRPLVERHSVLTRATHWAGTLAFIVLVMSGLQILNAAPYLDASDKSDPHRRVLSISGGTNAAGQAAGVTQIFGVRLTTTGLLGFTDDGQGGRSPRAFPGWITLPGYQDLADGRRWHLFFAWVMVLAGGAYLIGGLLNRDLSLLVLRPSDVPKLLPMQLYYLRLRREPPPHGKYNPLQKAAYTLVLVVLSPLIVLSGLALSPGIDAFAGPLTTLLGGRQFARLWHFVFMLALLGFVGVHLTLVASTGLINNLRSMVTGRYRLGKHEGEGP